MLAIKLGPSGAAMIAIRICLLGIAAPATMSLGVAGQSARGITNEQMQPLLIGRKKSH